MRTTLALCLTTLLALPVFAGDDPVAKEASLDDLLAVFFAEEDPGSRAAAGLMLAARFPDAAQVAAAIPAARTWKADAEKGTIIRWRRSTPDGVAHTVFANIPASYDAAKPLPVLVWLHGGVSAQRDGGGASGLRYLAEISDDGGFLLLCPSTQQGAEWWTPNGVGLVRGALGDLALRYRVDADRVAVGGFSDGASGCFHLLAHDPEPYCCFLPMMPHPGVTRLAGGPSFVANVRSRPVLAVNGGQDTLYPSARIKPMIEELKKAGCDLTWEDFPEAGHRLDQVLPDRWDLLRDFWSAHPRTALPLQIQWESAVPHLDGRFGWIEILAVDPEAPSAKGGKPAVLPDAARRPRLGVQLDRRFAGPGLRIGSVVDGSAADDAGFEAGDVITAVNGKVLEGPQAGVVLMKELAGMTDEDGVFAVMRGQEALEMRCRPRASGAGDVPRPKALGYGLPSGRIEAKVSGNRIEVTSRHVKRFKLHLADGLVDLAKPITVVVNGAVKFEGLAKGSTGAVLQEAVRAVAGSPLYRASIVVDP